MEFSSHKSVKNIAKSFYNGIDQKNIQNDPFHGQKPFIYIFLKVVL